MAEVTLYGARAPGQCVRTDSSFGTDTNRFPIQRTEDRVRKGWSGGLQALGLSKYSREGAGSHPWTYG